MEFNDGNQWHRLTNLDAYLTAGRDLFAYRVASAKKGVPYVDSAFGSHRRISAPLRGTLLYQFVYMNAGSPEAQADFFLRTLSGGLQQQEMVCIDPEVGGGFTADNVGDFTRRWLARVESALNTKAWVYVPSALASPLSGSVAADRVLWAPRYSGGAQRGSAPSWRHDVHQYTDRGFFPGSPDGPGDTSHTELTTETLLARCNPLGFAEPPHGGPA